MNHPVAGIAEAVRRSLRNCETADAEESRRGVLDCHRALKTAIHRHVLVAEGDRPRRSADRAQAGAGGSRPLAIVELNHSAERIDDVIDRNSWKTRVRNVGDLNIVAIGVGDLRREQPVIDLTNRYRR